MVILIGKSGSGKTTIANILCGKYGFSRIVTTTTRPIRPGEQQGVDYHFVSDGDFDALSQSGQFIETREYHVESGQIWRYGSPREDILKARQQDVTILTPGGCKEVLKKIRREKVIIVYVYANIKAIRHRLEIRGDKPDEIERRMKQDEEDFKGAEALADFIVYNHYGDDINETVGILLNHLRKRGVKFGKAENISGRNLP